MKVEQHFRQIKKKVEEAYGLARLARKVGVDPVADVEIPIATSLAEKATGLISTLYPQVGDEKIVKRILELEKKFGSLDPAVALSIGPGYRLPRAVEAMEVHPHVHGICPHQGLHCACRFLDPRHQPLAFGAGEVVFPDVA